MWIKCDTNGRHIQTETRYCAQSIFRCCVYSATRIHWPCSSSVSNWACQLARPCNDHFIRTKYLSTVPYHIWRFVFNTRFLCASMDARARLCVYVWQEYFMLVASWDQQFNDIVVFWRRCCHSYTAANCLWMWMCVRAHSSSSILDQMATQYVCTMYAPASSHSRYHFHAGVCARVQVFVCE